MRCIIFVALFACCLAKEVQAQHPLTNEFIREGQRRECDSLGGRYEYPKCYLPDQSQPAETPALGRIIVENQCRHPVRVVVSYRDEDDGKQLVGWIHLDGYVGVQSMGEGFLRALTGSLFPAAVAADYNGPILHNNKYAPALYAEATDESGLVWTGDDVIVFQGNEYAFFNADASGGQSIANPNTGENRIPLVCN